MSIELLIQCSAVQQRLERIKEWYYDLRYSPRLYLVPHYSPLLGLVDLDQPYLANKIYFYSFIMENERFQLLKVDCT